jgi:hypothetical protein
MTVLKVSNAVTPCNSRTCGIKMISPWGQRRLVNLVDLFGAGRLPIITSIGYRTADKVTQRIAGLAIDRSLRVTRADRCQPAQSAALRRPSLLCRTV